MTTDELDCTLADVRAC